jgi:predicted permease
MESAVFAQDLRVTPSYFRALGIPILRGRSLSPTVDSLAPPEIVINQELARQLWPGQDPIGKRIQFGHDASVVVGVAANVRPRALDDDEILPQMYNSLLAGSYQNLALVARGRIPADALAGLLQQAVRSVAPDQAVYNVRTMEQVISDTIAPRRTNTLLITIFGVLALVLAAVGVYGVIAYEVTRRTREIGIRIALGARPREVMSQVLRGGIVLAAVGIAIGLAGAWMLTRLLSNLVYGVSPRDPVAFILAPLVLLAIAILATLLPARRATRIDPVTAMRAE